MEIHSSSLAFLPAGNNLANNNDEPLLSSNNKKQNEESLTLPPPKVVEKSFNAKNFQQLSADIEKQQDRPANKRTSLALDAYIQQNTQPLKNQRSELVSGIDLFV